MWWPRDWISILRLMHVVHSGCWRSGRNCMKLYSATQTYSATPVQKRPYPCISALAYTIINREWTNYPSHFPERRKGSAWFGTQAVLLLVEFPILLHLAWWYPFLLICPARINSHTAWIDLNTPLRVLGLLRGFQVLSFARHQITIRIFLAVTFLNQFK